MSSNGIPWTEEEDRLVRELWISGASAKEIGERLKRTRNSIIGYIHRHAVVGPNRSKPSTIARAKEINITPPKVRIKVERPVAERAHKPKAVASKEMLDEITSIERNIDRPAWPTAKPWLERRAFECSFPVFGDRADVHSCCVRIKEIKGYCPEHHALMFVKPTHRIRAPRF